MLIGLCIIGAFFGGLILGNLIVAILYKPLTKLAEKIANKIYEGRNNERF